MISTGRTRLAASESDAVVDEVPEIESTTARELLCLLSYRPEWWTGWDSNPQPADRESKYPLPAHRAREEIYGADSGAATYFSPQVAGYPGSESPLVVTVMADIAITVEIADPGTAVRAAAFGVLEIGVPGPTCRRIGCCGVPHMEGIPSPEAVVGHGFGTPGGCPSRAAGVVDGVRAATAFGAANHSRIVLRTRVFRVQSR